jgi:hypothetical protein
MASMQSNACGAGEEQASPQEVGKDQQQDACFYAKLDDGHARLLAVKEAAQPFVMKQLFVAVVKHLGLTWEGDMEQCPHAYSRSHCFIRVVE